MALFTDLDFISTADLQALDQECARVATSEGILLDSTGGAVGICTLAIQEAGADLQAKIQTFAGYPTLGGVGWVHNAAVLNIGTQNVNRPRLFLTQIVLDAQYAGFASPLKRWVAYKALSLLYADAAGRKNSQNDRYATKRDYYAKRANEYFRATVIPSGIPFVSAPLPCPGAVHEINSGTWAQGNVTVVAGSGPGTATPYYVAITYVDQSRYVSAASKGNAESGASAAFAATLDSTHAQIAVDITPLNPPGAANNPQLGISQGILPRLAATGWNVYAGTSIGAMYLQNATPIAIATKTYTFTPSLTGAVLGSGQFADANMPLHPTLMRG